jgi:hypothetical protein
MSADVDDGADAPIGAAALPERLLTWAETDELVAHAEIHGVVSFATDDRNEISDDTPVVAELILIHGDNHGAALRFVPGDGWTQIGAVRGRIPPETVDKANKLLEQAPGPSAPITTMGVQFRRGRRRARE